MDDKTVPESFDAHWPIPFYPPRSCFLFFARRLVEAFSHLGHGRHETVPLTSCDRRVEDALLCLSYSRIRRGGDMSESVQDVLICAVRLVVKNKEREDRSLETTMTHNFIYCYPFAAPETQQSKVPQRRQLLTLSCTWQLVQTCSNMQQRWHRAESWADLRSRA